MLNRVSLLLLLTLLVPVTAPASMIQLPQTGQTRCWDMSSPANEIACPNTGQDGELKTGKPWPSPRFVDNANGTVTDNMTGLVWLKNATCFPAATWDQALVDAASVANGTCGLTDGSTAGSWRMPNAVEMESIESPAATDTIPPLADGSTFTNVQFNVWYWTSTTYAPSPQYAWGLLMIAGQIQKIPDVKSSPKNFMLVRDPS